MLDHLREQLLATTTHKNDSCCKGCWIVLCYFSRLEERKKVTNEDRKCGTNLIFIIYFVQYFGFDLVLTGVLFSVWGGERYKPGQGLCWAWASWLTALPSLLCCTVTECYTKFLRLPFVPALQLASFSPWVLCPMSRLGPKGSQTPPLLSVAFILVTV